MDAALIVERGVYAQGEAAGYFRQVEAIVPAPGRPGGRVVQWSTDGFNVQGAKARTWGKCGINTFARWAKVRVS